MERPCQTAQTVCMGLPSSLFSLTWGGKQNVPCLADSSCSSPMDTSGRRRVTGPNTVPWGRHRFGVRNRTGLTTALAHLPWQRRSFAVCPLSSKPAFVSPSHMTSKHSVASPRAVAAATACTAENQGAWACTWHCGGMVPGQAWGI